MRIKPFCLSFWAPPVVRPQAILIGKMIPEWIRQGVRPVILTYKKAERWDIDAPLYEIQELKLSKVLRKISLLRGLLRKRYEQKLFKTAAETIKKHNLGLVFSFTNPQDSNILGAMLKKRLGIKFISHFSDPWYDNPLMSLSSSLKKRILKREREIIENSDRVIFVSEQLKTVVMGKYPGHWRDKAVVIPHCYALRDSPLVERNLSDKSRTYAYARDKFVFSHIGSFYKKRNPEMLFRAFSNLFIKQPYLRQRCQLHLVGTVNNYDTNYSRKELEQTIGHYRLADVVEIIPPLSYGESLRHMEESDCLVAIDVDVPNSPFFPSKLVDYASSHRIILGIANDKTATADFLTNMGYSYFNFKQIDNLTDYLEKLIKGEVKTQLNSDYLKQFDVKVTTAQLIEQFEQITSICR